MHQNSFTSKLVKFFADIAQHAQHAPDPVTKRYALISLGPLSHAILVSNKDNISKVIEELSLKIYRISDRTWCSISWKRREISRPWRTVFLMNRMVAEMKSKGNI
jgi:hypothetical protein